MEQLWVALLSVSIALSASSSVLHGVASGPPISQVIPYEVAYTNAHSPIVLSQLHGLRIDEALAAVGHGQVHAPAPVVEASAEEISQNNLINSQLYEQILRSQAGSEANNAIPVGATSAGDEVAISQSAQPVPSLGPSEIPVAPTVADLLTPGPEVSPIPVEAVPSQVGDVRLPQAIPNKSGNGILINAEEGKLQMQATLATGGESVKVSVGDVSQPNADSVSVIIPELPVTGTTKESKPHGIANVNVNVNVNVNGDGTGSVINSTSVADITAPIKTDHKKCN